jgi:hypothetical protein
METFKGSMAHKLVFGAKAMWGYALSIIVRSKTNFSFVGAPSFPKGPVNGYI